MTIALMQTKNERQPVPFESELADWRVLIVEIHGVTPLLMHNPAHLMTPSTTSGASRKRVPTPEEEASQGVYRTPDGHLYVGADHLREAMLRAASGLRVNRKPLRPVLAAALFILEPHFVITRETKPLTTWDRIDVRRCVVQRQGIMRARPVVEVPWGITARYQWDRRLIRDSALLVQVIQEAGLRIGLLDYRPERGGIFGRFEVSDAWEESL